MPWRTNLQVPPGSGEMVERFIDKLPTWLAIPVICIVILSTVGKPVLNWLKDIYTGIRESSTIRQELAEVKRKVLECESERELLEDEREDLSTLLATQKVIITDIRRLLRGLLNTQEEDLKSFREIIRSFLTDIE